MALTVRMCQVCIIIINFAYLAIKMYGFNSNPKTGRQECKKDFRAFQTV